jgi:hypothetical protein
MVNIVPFEGKQLPAYLKNVDKAALNDDLVSGGGGFPVISIKGKTFAIVRNGEREILPNPKDPDSPATYIDVVILKANKGLSKIYYAKKFDDDSKAEKPDCYSADGITPAADAQSPQAKKCATCKHNQWGSRISDQGSKGKACQDNKRIAVTTPDQINEPYLMRVPPASLGGLTEYAGYLAKRGVKYNMVVTKISFDPEAATPKLLFKAVGLLDDKSYGDVQEALKLDVVERIVGTMTFEDADAVDKPAAGEEAAKAIAKAATPSRKVTETEVKDAVAAATGEVTTEVATPEVEVDLDNLSFDD